MSKLQTSDPAALRFLLNETLFVLEDPVPGVAGSPSWVFWGSEKPRVLFLTADSVHGLLSPPAFEAFSKTLSALKLEEKDVALLNTAAQPKPWNFEEGVGFFEPKQIVLLGELGQTRIPATDIPILKSFSFESMLHDNEKKRTFWTQLKAFIQS